MALERRLIQVRRSAWCSKAQSPKTASSVRTVPISRVAARVEELRRALPSNLGVIAVCHAEGGRAWALADSRCVEDAAVRPGPVPA